MSKRKDWRWITAATIGGVLALFITECNRDNDSELFAQQRELGTLQRDADCRPAGFIIASGELQRTSDNSDVFYLGGLTLIPTPNSNAELQLRGFAPHWRSKPRYFRLILVEEVER